MPQGKYAPTELGLAHRINSLDFLAVRIHDGGRSPAPHATLRSWVKPRLDVADVNLKMLNKEAYLNISRTTPGFFLAALLCTGSACGPTVLDPGSNTCTPECDSWEICVDGACQESCVSDAECGNNAFCIQSICTPLTPCQDTGQCEADASCINGFCIPLNRQCVGDSSCNPGSWCNNGICTDEGEAENGDDRCAETSDCPTGQTCEFGFCTGGSTDGSTDGSSGGSEPDDCNGNDDGLLGDSCNEASDCCNGLCLGDPASAQGFCTEICNSYADCNPVGFNHEMWCLDAGEDGSLCAFSDFQQSCDLATDCVGQICLKSTSDSSCSVECSSGDMCPPGTACGLVSANDGAGGASTIQTCTPIGSACAISSDCLSGTCIGDDETGIAYCTAFCSANDATACPTNYNCTLVQGSDVPVCVR